MPISPILIPLVLAGAMLGSILVSGKRKVSKRKFLGVSLLGGLLNAANAYIIYLLFPPTSFRRFGQGSLSGGSFGGGSTTFTFTESGAFRGAAGGATSLSSFLLLSFITGLLIVIVVVGVALAFARYKSKHLDDESGEPNQGDQEELEEDLREGREET